MTIQQLATEGNKGKGVKVAVVDVGIPTNTAVLEKISTVAGAVNFTSDTSLDSDHSSFIASLLFDRKKGLCPEASAYYAKVFDKGTACPETVAAAIDFAVDIWEVDIINLSLGFDAHHSCPKVIRDACKRAREKNVVLVAAAGNDGGKTMWPAALPEVLSVGSSDGVCKESYSNYGKIDLVTFGTNITGLNSLGKEVYRTGTSYSSALVTGIATLLLAKLRPNSSTKEAGKDLADPIEDIKRNLKKLCTDIDKVGFDPNTGFGFLALDINPSPLQLLLSRICAKIESISETLAYLIRRI